MKKKDLFKIILFTAVVLQLLYYLPLFFFPIGTPSVPAEIFSENPNIKDNKQKGFYREKPNSLDVVFLGSSNIFCSINSNVIWEETGITSYNFGSEQQELGTSYYYLKQVFETQSPKVVVIDIHFDGSEESIGTVQAHFAFDHLKNDIHKIEGIWNRVKDNLLEIYIPLIAHHEQWKSINLENFRINPNPNNLLKGAFIYWRTHASEEFTVPDDLEASDLPERTVYWLESIRHLCEIHDCECLFVKTPVSFYDEIFSYFEAVAEYCEKNDLPFLFMNKMNDEIGLDFKTDFADGPHLNWYGQEKLSKFIGRYLQEKYHIENKKGLPEYTRWDQDYQEMMYYINQYIQKTTDQK